MPTKKLRIHFIGIGGIGVSALAKYYLEKGYAVSGSDLASSEITDALKKLGAKIFIGPHWTRNVLGMIDLVVYSPAVPEDNPELKEAKKLGIKCLSYPQALGELTKKYFTIAVSGTHGKSTTAAMIGLLLIKAGFDPTVIVGTKLREFGDSNCRVGKSPEGPRPQLGGGACGARKYLVIEADEWQASFLNYWPKIIVLTNIEREHLDYYKNLNNILKTYKEYISHFPKDGVLIANRDNENITKIIKQKSVNTTFSAIAKNIVYFFSKQSEAREVKKLLKIPGEHNVSNALAALSVARALKIPDKISFKALSEYKGSWRRFEIKKVKLANQDEKCSRPIEVVSDYAHHPTEIRVTLKAAREKYPKKKIWCIFQPHQYQRTFYLFNDFVKVFREAPIDKLILTDIYDVAGREEKQIKKKINSEKLTQAIKNSKSIVLRSTVLSAQNVIYLSGFKKIKDYLKRNLKGGEVVIIMGAGDIYKLADYLST